jgi:intracellular septation protein A
MFLAALAFIGYAVVFFLRNFFSSGFELGVQTIGGSTRADLQAMNPELLAYIGHLHVATAGFIAATGIAVAFLSWYGVRRGELWAWIAAVAAPVVGLAVALPMHYFGLFDHNWVTHLGPIYLATLVFVIGALIVLKGILQPVEQ